MSQPPIRILCLHGYTQSGPLFSNKTGALRKALTTSLSPRPVELHYPTGPLALRPEDIPGYEAPISAPADTTSTSSNQPGAPASTEPSTEVSAYGWWRRQPHPPPPPPTNGFSSSSYTGLDATLTLLAQTIVKHGPFDGVLGFSQGACLAAMVCALLDGSATRRGASTTRNGAEATQNGASVAQNGVEAIRNGTSAQSEASATATATANTDFGSFLAPFLREDGSVIQQPFKFAVLVSGFKTPGYEGLWEPRIGVRSLHVVGSLDVVVDEARSRELADVFEGAEVVVHPGGHFVPSAKVWVGVITGFVRRCLES